MKKNKLLIIPIIILMAILIYCVSLLFNQEGTVASSSTTKDIEMNIDTDNGDEKIDWSKYQEESYTLTKSITITSSGTYNLTGSIANGLITIDTDSNVKLVLNNVSITNTSGPAIFVKNAEDVVIELAANSENYIEDGTTYSGYETDEVGTIFSHDDLTIEGTGKIEIKSNNEDAIVSKDDLKITSGTFIINSNDDGIRGKDSVYIKDGNFTINSSGDGIKSTNDTETDKGYILIEKGAFNIVSELDGIQAETKLLIQGGTFNIKTGGGSSNSSSSNSDWGNWGGGRQQKGYSYSNSTSTTNSAKGLKAVGNLVIEAGTFELNTSDDAIHCNDYAGIKSGTINITSGDDGIHADTELIIDGGTINITKSYEGLEAAKITINNGKINLVASDDGINIAGGNDSSSMQRPGSNSYTTNTNNILTINNGTITIDATGDGIDINGSAYINGGTTIVYGPTNSGNGALDYDQTFTVNGGTLLAGGASGMLQSCSSSSETYSITIVFNGSKSSNDTITIKDTSNNEIVSYKSSKSYSSLVVASPKLKKGNKYTIEVNGTTYQEVTISTTITTVGSSNNHSGNQRR